MLGAVLARRVQLTERASRQRGFRQADGRPGIMRAWLVARGRAADAPPPAPITASPRRANPRLGHIQQPRKDPPQVGVQRKLVHAKGQRGDGARGVTPNTWQPAQRCKVAGTSPPCCSTTKEGFVQFTGAAVVAESLPRHSGPPARKPRRRKNGGKPFHPVFKIGDDRLDARMLAHHLRDPHGVGVRVTAPGQRAPVASDHVSRRAASSGLAGISGRGR